MTTALQYTDPLGRNIEVPESRARDQAYFTLESSSDDIRAYYEDNGYVVVRDLIPKALCDSVSPVFESEVKPYNGYIYRQTTASPEKHAWTDQGFMLNPILNVQSLDPRALGKFRALGTSIITHANVQKAVSILFGEPGKVVQSMYFEGNPATWPHQDTYYLDAEQIGRMTAAWFAMEDIAPGAGRFFIYPKSHKIDLFKNGGTFDVAFNHDRYKKLVVDTIREYRLVCSAPALGKGDVLFWAAKTIHGSLSTVQVDRSRKSFTAHFIPASSRFLQFQARVKKLRLRTVNTMPVHHPKDLSEPLNRAILFVETRFPRAFRFTKKMAIKFVTR
jgi:phytanoyl-CoA hydroxylase